MSCESVRESLSSYLDDRLGASERSGLLGHLDRCAECAAELERYARLRSALRALPRAIPPDRLASELQVLASRESLHRRSTGSLPALAEFWASRIRLVVDNLMRPMALPFAGGLASAVFLFSFLVPTLGFLRDPTHDVPTALYTEASVDNVADFTPKSKCSDDTLIEVEIDGQGRVVDYYVPQGQLTGDIGNLLLFTTFTPARMFGQPTSGKLVIRRSRIVVKG